MDSRLDTNVVRDSGTSERTQVGVILRDTCKGVQIAYSSRKGGQASGTTLGFNSGLQGLESCFDGLRVSNSGSGKGTQIRAIFSQTRQSSNVVNVSFVRIDQSGERASSGSSRRSMLQPVHSEFAVHQVHHQSEFADLCRHSFGSNTREQVCTGNFLTRKSRTTVSSICETYKVRSSSPTDWLLR